MSKVGSEVLSIIESRIGVITCTLEYFKPAEWEYDSDCFTLDTTIVETESGLDFNATLTGNYDNSVTPVALSVTVGAEGVAEDILIPGVWYHGNKYTGAGAPSISLGHHWMFREDRISTPGVLITSDITTIRMFSTRKPTADAVGGQVYDMENGEKAIITETEIAAIGFKQNNESLEIVFRNPYTEEPAPYRKKNYFLSSKNMKSESAFRLLSKGDQIHIDLHIQKTPAQTFPQDLAVFIREAFSQTATEKPLQPYECSELKSIMSNFLMLSYFSDGKAAGFAGKEIETFSESFSTHQTELGFIGRNMLIAAYSLEYGRKLHLNKFITMGRSVINTMTSAGFYRCCFLEEYSQELSTWSSKEKFYLRRQCEGVMALHMAIQNEKIPSTDWINARDAVVRYIASLQQDDGSLPFTFDANGNIHEISGIATAVAIPVLLLVDKAQALKAGEYILHEHIPHLRFYSQSLDSRCEDKESGIITLTALLELFSVNDESKWIDAASLTANYILSWFFTWDVPFVKGTLLNSIDFKTSGWGIASIENAHIDCYIFDFCISLHKLSDITGDVFYHEVSDFIYNSVVSRLLQHAENDVGIAHTGSIPEVVQQTDWDYGQGGKGTYNYINALGWTFASNWMAVTEHEKYKSDKK